MYYVYFLFLADGSIYKGLSENLRQRIANHQRGNVVSTRHKRPLRLLGYEGYAMKSDAERRERFLKTTEGRRLLKQQYRDILNAMRSRKDN